jgi:hypothetical protein
VVQLIATDTATATMACILHVFGARQYSARALLWLRGCMVPAALCGNAFSGNRITSVGSSRTEPHDYVIPTNGRGKLGLTLLFIDKNYLSVVLPDWRPGTDSWIPTELVPEQVYYNMALTRTQAGNGQPMGRDWMRAFNAKEQQGR